MKYLSHSSKTKEIKPSNAALISKALTNLKTPTRKSIAAYASVTEMTVCRAVARLTDSGFALESPMKNDASHQISIAENLRFIILDLSADTYFAHLLTPTGKSCEQISYNFNHRADAFDNLSVFLDRAYDLISKKTNHFSGIGIIFSLQDNNFKSQTNKLVADRFLCPSVFNIDIPSALLSLKDSSIDSYFPSSSMYYLCIGNRNLAYFLGDGFAIRSNPQILIDESGKTLEEDMNRCISPEMLYDIIFKIVNSASALLDAKLFVIESDRFVFGSSISHNLAEKLKVSFTDERRICFSDQRPNYYIKGALIALQNEVARNILSN